MARLGGVGQVNDEIVGHIDTLPAAVVELHAVRAGVMYRVRLGQIVEILCAAAEVFRRVGGIAEGEFPATVEAHRLALGSCRNNGDEKDENVKIP